MLGTSGGISSMKYNKNTKEKKKPRRRSYLRKINERWRTEYEKYNMDKILENEHGEGDI